MTTEDILNQNTTFKLYDKVKVLRREAGDVNWRGLYYGVIVELGNTFARVWDTCKTDQNLGTIPDSCEWQPFNSKCLKLVKD